MNNRNEFYESKWFYVFQGMVGAFWSIIVFWALSDKGVKQYPKVWLCCAGCFGIYLLIVALQRLYSREDPYVVVDALRIKFKEKSMLPFLDFQQEQSVLWNEISAVVCVPPYIKLGPIKLYMAWRMGQRKIPALKLELKNGKTRWILLHTLSEKTRQRVCKAVQEYKPIQNEEKSVGLGGR